MAYPDGDIDPLEPQNPDAIGLGAAEIRLLKRQILDRLSTIVADPDADPMVIDATLIQSSGRVLANSTADATTDEDGSLATLGGLSTKKKGFFGELVSMTKLVLREAASRIVPGVTSLSLRNNADNADNVLVTDAGDVTVRKKLTLSDNAGAESLRVENGTSFLGGDTVIDGELEADEAVIPGNIDQESSGGLINTTRVGFVGAGSGTQDGDLWFDGVDLKLLSGGNTYTISKS